MADALFAVGERRQNEPHGQITRQNVGKKKGGIILKAKVKPHKLLSLLLALVMAVGMLPGMGMTALAVEDGDEGNGPPAVEVV